MKRQVLAIFIFAILLSGLFACDKTNEITTNQSNVTSTPERQASEKEPCLSDSLPPETEVIETQPFTQIIYSNNLPYLPPEENEDTSFTLKITCYEGTWFGVTHKEITGSYAQKLATALSSLSETDEREAKIGDESLWEDEFYLPVEEGTMWIEVGGECYRYTPGDDICRVEEKLGEGVILSTTDEVRELIRNSSSYWPYNYYYGKYKDGVLTIEHKFAAYSPITITVKDIYVEKIEEPNNFIILEFVANTDMIVSGYLDCETGGCIIFDGGEYYAELKAGVPQTVKIPFGGDSYGYYIALNEKNTHIYISIRL